MARLTGSNADEARGSCQKCGRVGHLTFQCRNFLTAKEEAATAAVAALERERNGAKLEGGNVTAASSSEEESEISDSDEDSEMERALARLGRSKKSSRPLFRIGKGQTRRNLSHRQEGLEFQKREGKLPLNPVMRAQTIHETRKGNGNTGKGRVQVDGTGLDGQRVQ